MALGSPQWMYNSGSEFTLDQSLRTDRASSTTLTKTFASAGNRRTWSFSVWFKRGNIGGVNNSGNKHTFFNGQDQDNFVRIADDCLQIYAYDGSTDYGWISTAVVRDTSAWYHALFVMDTTSGTASQRQRIYLNGVELTAKGTDYGEPPQNYEGFVNTATKHYVAGSYSSTGFDGYLAEMHFIDGTALTPSSFGETGDYGEWKPIEVSGLTYGTNGFYLPFKQDYTVEGFSTVTYKGEGGSRYVGGVGFQPDFVWIKRRNGNGSHRLTDAVRGAGKDFSSDDTGAEATGNNCSAFHPDGFTNGGNSDDSGDSYVVWNWDMGGSNASNSNGSITSTVRANTTYGQSIVSYTGTGSNATVGHGLSSAPEMMLVKSRSHAKQWAVYHASLPAGGSYNAEQYSLKLNDNSVEYDNSNRWNDTAPTNTVFSLGGSDEANYSGTNVAYCWHSVTGYSKFNRYSGDGSTDGSNAVNCGFEPAFVMIKCTNDAESWWMFDNLRNPLNDDTDPKRLQADSSAAETTGGSTGSDWVEFTSTGFKLTGSGGGTNGNGNTYVYAAFADKREYAYWLDQSGNNNDWTSNNLTESDISVDSPTNNFCVMNPLSPNTTNLTFSEGNLKLAGWDIGFFGTMGVSSGKWYWEMHSTNASGNANNTSAVGIVHSDTLHDTVDSSSNSGFEGYSGTKARGYYGYDGNKLGASSSASYGNTFVTGDIIGVALNLDDGEITFYKNNVSQGVAFTSLESGYWLPLWQNWTSSVGVMNFGQDSSFSGIKTPQGNQDGNDIGDFYYTPPTGFLALCTKNLPDPAVTPSEHFNTVLYSGNGSSGHAITGVGFQPGLTWTAERTSTSANHWFDSVRGYNKAFYTNSTAAESNQSAMAVASDGFTVGVSGGFNENSQNYASWNWKAGTSVSGNSSGSGTAQSYTGSVNTDAGFSIIKYTGNGTDGMQVPHHLGVVPDAIFIKSLTTQSWNCFFPNAIGADKGLQLDNTGPWGGPFFSTHLSDDMPTTSVVKLGNGAMTNTFADGVGQDYMMYCWANKDGYLKAGGYVGNGSADGTFVYTGFRPAFLLVKVTGLDGERWFIFDNKRDPENIVDTRLAADDSLVESTGSSQAIDFLSNGFKARANQGAFNTNAYTYVYICMAETPFKYSNAR